MTKIIFRNFNKITILKHTYIAYKLLGFLKNFHNYEMNYDIKVFAIFRAVNFGLTKWTGQYLRLCGTS